MMVLDRVLCDFCLIEVGQIMGGEPQVSGVLVDQRIAPHFCVCPDCYDQSVVEEVAA